MAITVKPTAEEVFGEGQLQDSYFPNCADHTAVTTFIDSRIDDVDAEVQLKTGDNYTSADDRVLKLLHKAEVYLVLSRLWQVIKSVMDGYDAEALPPEYVDPDQAASNRDYYAGEAEAILIRYDDDGVTTPKQFIGGFMASSADDYSGPLGSGY